MSYIHPLIQTSVSNIFIKVQVTMKYKIQQKRHFTLKDISRVITEED